MEKYYIETITGFNKSMLCRLKKKVIPSIDDPPEQKCSVMYLYKIKMPTSKYISSDEKTEFNIYIKFSNDKFTTPSTHFSDILNYNTTIEFEEPRMIFRNTNCFDVMEILVTLNIRNNVQFYHTTIDSCNFFCDNIDEYKEEDEFKLCIREIKLFNGHDLIGYSYNNIELHFKTFSIKDENEDHMTKIKEKGNTENIYKFIFKNRIYETNLCRCPFCFARCYSAAGIKNHIHFAHYYYECEIGEGSMLLREKRVDKLEVYFGLVICHKNNLKMFFKDMDTDIYNETPLIFINTRLKRNKPIKIYKMKFKEYQPETFELQKDYKFVNDWIPQFVSHKLKAIVDVDYETLELMKKWNCYVYTQKEHITSLNIKYHVRKFVLASPREFAVANFLCTLFEMCVLSEEEMCNILKEGIK